MREIKTDDITQTVARLFEHSCHYLPEDVLAALKKARGQEKSPVSRDVLDRILENVDVAGNEQIPLCQDTGLSIIWLELGQEARITGGKITVMPKGGGSENMSRLTVLSPAQGRQGIIDFVVNRVDESGSNPCPPVIVGVGIGGTTEKTMMLAKKALLRKVGEPNPEPEVAEMEREILTRCNNLGIGTMGYGGTVTALAVHVEVFPCHIASLPVAVNMQCWCDRHEDAVL
jgi:fumarate hydratase subunit alpha